MKNRKLGNTATFVAMVGINMAANLIPIGGNTTGEVSANYPSLFTPAPITFAIWGVIYLLLAGFVAYQWGSFDTTGESQRLRERVGAWFIVSCLMNIGWIFAWHFDAIGVSLLFMAALLVSLLFIERRINGIEKTRLSRILVHAPFDIYFGWILVAAIANTGVLLAKAQWNYWGLGQPFGTIFALLAATGILSVIIVMQHKPLVGLTAIWAFTGILIRHLSSTGLEGQYPFVLMTVVFCMVFLMSMVLYSAASMIDWKNHPHPSVRDKNAHPAEQY